MKKISFPGGCSIFRSRIVSHFVLSNNFFTKREFTIHLFSPRGNKSCDVTVFPRLFRVTKKIPLYVAALFFSISRGEGAGRKTETDKRFLEAFVRQSFERTIENLRRNDDGAKWASLVSSCAANLVTGVHENFRFRSHN